MRTKSFWILMMLFSACCTFTAHAAQFSDHFDNAAYDGGVDTSKWNASETGTLTQNSAASSIQLTPDDADYATAAICTKTKFSVASTDDTRGTKIHVVINNLQPSGAGYYTCITDIMICDEASTPTSDFHGYGGNALCLQFEWIGTETMPSGRHLTVSAYQKEAGNAGSMGTQLFNGQNWINQSGELPLDFDIIVNEKYFEFQDAGNRWGGSTSVQSGGWAAGEAALQIVMRNTQSAAGGRGNITLDEVSIGDAQADAFIGPKTSVAYNFDDAGFDGGFSNYVLYDRAGWGALNQTAGGCEFSSGSDDRGHMLYSRDGIVSGGINDGVSFACDVVSITPSSGQVAAFVALASGSSPWHFWAPWPPASIWATLSTATANGNNLKLNVYSKPWSGAATQLVIDQDVYVSSYPFSVELQANAKSEYALLVNDELITKGKNHTAAFEALGSHYICAGGVQNIGTGRGTVKLDNFSLAPGAAKVPAQLSLMQVD